MHQYSQKLLIRKDYINKEGKSALYFQVIINRKIIKVNPRVSWDVTRYDFVKNELIPRGKKDQEWIDAKIIIDKVRSDINDIFIKYRTSDKLLTENLFYKELNAAGSKKDFIHYMESKVKYRFRGGLIDESTYKKHIGTVDRLKEFKNEIAFSELSARIFEDFNVFLKKVKKNSENTRWGRFKNISTYLNIAKDEGIVFENPFLNMNDKPKQVPGTIEYLTKQEVKKLKQLYEKNDLPGHLMRELKSYLFSCHTGVRISDIAHLSNENIIGDELVFIPHKTRRFNRPVRIPLLSYAKS